ncbi:hypothetical protein KR009_009538 [Drosophila setifemur]|nr:hypothetical protein KR009_009538 [Drosophila setifemur]
MDLLSINQKVLIRRSDGRIHEAGIIKLDGGTNNMVTVEWPEGHIVRGKEMPLELVILLNPDIFDPPRFSGAVANQTASIPPRSLTRSPARSRLLSRLVSAKPRVTVTPPSRLDEVVIQMDKMREQRERRREQQNQAREQREQLKNEDPGNPNWEIARMIRLHRLQMDSQPLTGASAQGPRKEHQILVCVRKRPLNRRELGELRELDVVSVPSKDMLVVHEPRKHVDLVKFLDNHSFRFDYVFNEDCDNATVYQFTARPLVRHVFDGGMATCFAYGQTGSGKTHTMGGEFAGKQQHSGDGIYGMAAKDIFSLLVSPQYASLKLRVSCSFFEIYGSRVCDLLRPGKPQLKVLEDGRQQVQVVGLTENYVKTTNEVLDLLQLGNRVRTSGQTSANSKSSRSHAVFQMVLRSSQNEALHGKFSLIDLAGNERGADNSSSDRQTRLEGSDINKSLLVLKECIRALGRPSGTHLPFRGSKLTQVLRDSFIGGKKVKTCMIAMISPGLHSVEHTLNTLRYADRVKELTVDPASAKRLANPSAEAASAFESNSWPDIVSQSQDQNPYPFASSISLPGEVEPPPSAEGPGQGQGQPKTLNNLNGTQMRLPQITGPSRSISSRQLTAKNKNPRKVVLMAKSLASFRGRNFP